MAVPVSGVTAPPMATVGPSGPTRSSTGSPVGVTASARGRPVAATSTGAPTPSAVTDHSTGCTPSSPSIDPATRAPPSGVATAASAVEWSGPSNGSADHDRPSSEA